MILIPGYFEAYGFADAVGLGLLVALLATGSGLATFSSPFEQALNISPATTTPVTSTAPQRGITTPVNELDLFTMRSPQRKKNDVTPESLPGIPLEDKKRNPQ
ncbi:MAG: hypothetical protein ACRC0L_08265 [Angustibacter sp.]